MRNFSDCIILFGGSSSERLVSVASAQNLSAQIPEAALWFLDKTGGITRIEGHELAAHENAFTAEFTPRVSAHYKSLRESYQDLREKIVIIALHGTEGEDGTLQRFLEDGQILYTGTGSSASALAFDKQRTKQLAREHDLPVPEDITVSEFSALKEEQLKKFLRLAKKIVLKPNANGSSVGLFIISTEEDLLKAIAEAREKNLTNYLAEPFIEGREITVGVRERSDLTLKALPCSEVRVKSGRQFDYEGKYLGSGVEELTPAPLSPEISRECQKLALEMHKLVGCEGYSRTDMILTERGPYLLEINTLPGLSKASFIPQQLRVDGMSLREFFQEQIDLL